MASESHNGTSLNQSTNHQTHETTVETVEDKQVNNQTAPMLGSSPIKSLRTASNQQSQISTIQSSTKKKTNQIQLSQISSQQPQPPPAPVISSKNERLYIGQSGGPTNRSTGGGGGGGQPSQIQNTQQQLIIISVSNAAPPNLSAGVPNLKRANNLGGGQGNSNQTSNATSASNQGQDHKDPKQALLMSIQEIVRLVIQRSEDSNQLRQIIDLKAKKLKSKYTDSSFFYNLLQREWQRQSVESYHLNKTSNVRVEDKSPLIKTLQKQVKKMLKPFNRRKPGPGNEDYMHCEVHLSEVLLSQDTEIATSNQFQQQYLNASSNQSLPTLAQLQAQAIPILQAQNQQDSSNSASFVGGMFGQVQLPPQYKELRKRNFRIIQASFKEQLVDPQVALSICIQASRQAFFDEISEYFQCAHEIIIAAAPGTIPSNCNIQTENFNYQNLKKVIHKAKQQAKVQINLQKKLDKIYKYLFDQNSEILKQINVYRDHYQTTKIGREVLSEQSTKPYTYKSRRIFHEPGILSQSLDSRNSVQQSIVPLELGVTPLKSKEIFQSSSLTTRLIEKPNIIFKNDQTGDLVSGLKLIRTAQPTQNQQPQQQATTASISEFGRPLNSTMANFMNTPQLKKSHFQLGKQQSDIPTNALPQPAPLFNPSATMFPLSNQGTPGQIGNGGSIMRGSSRVSKLQPIVARDASLKKMLTNGKDGLTSDAPPFLNSKLASVVASTELWDKNRSIKKANQLPALQANINPLSNQDTCGQFGPNTSIMTTFSKRGGGLEPLPPPQEHHLSIEQRIAPLRLDSSSVSPLKRRAKVVLQGYPRQESSYNNEDSSQPLLKVFNTATGQSQVFSDDNESVHSNNQANKQENRKIIRATITIPMPKADLGSFKIRNKKSAGGTQLLQQMDNANSNSLLIPYDDESPLSEEDEFLDSPADAKHVNKEQPFPKQQREPQKVNQTSQQKLQITVQTKNNNLQSPLQLLPSPQLSPNIFSKSSLIDFSKCPINDRFDSLFSRYFNKKGILAFIVNHRAKVIQRFYRNRVEMKLRAKQLIVKRFRLFIQRQQRIHLFATKLLITVTQKKAVRQIERSYIRYRDRRRSRAKQEQISEWSTPASKSLYNIHIAKIVRLQRFFRKRLANRLTLGRKLVKWKLLQDQLFHDQCQKRYIPIAAFEGKLLQEYMTTELHKSALDEYIYQQQESYIEGLYSYEEVLSKAVESNFKEKDWFYNRESREWSNDRMQIAFRGPQFISTASISNGTNIQSGHQPNSNSVPLQYLIDSNRRLLLTAPCQGFDDIQSAGEALTSLLQQDFRNQRQTLQNQIKCSRHAALMLQVTRGGGLAAESKNKKRCRSK